MKTDKLHKKTCERICAKRQISRPDHYAKLFHEAVENSKARKDNRPSRDTDVYKATVRLSKDVEKMQREILAHTGETQATLISRLIEKEWEKVKRQQERRRKAA